MFQTKVVEKIKTHILCPIIFFRKSFSLWHNVEKYCREEQATDDNMAHAQVLLRMRNVSDKSCTENQNTHFMSHNFFSKII